VTEKSPTTEGSTRPSLTARTAKGAGWLLGWRMATRLLGVLSTVVLVRLLPPADFGLVALATSFSIIVEWLSGLGVNDALVREKHITRALYDTGFTLNLIRGIVMGIAIAAEAVPVGNFFGDPRLASILFVLAAAMFVSSFENIGIVDFRRELLFDKEFRLSVLPRIASIIMSIGYAIVFRDHWALVVGIVTNRGLRTILSYWIHPYQPRLTLSAWRDLIHYSFFGWLSAILMLIRDRVDTIVIGRILGPTAVGVYSVGWEIGALTSSELVEPLSAAMFASFAEAGRTGANISEGYFKAISATLMMTLPLGLGLSLFAAPLVHLAFGALWAPAVPLVQIFALVCMLKVVAYFSGVLLNAQGLIHVQVKILTAGVMVRLILLAILIGPFGLMGAAVSAAGCMVIEELLFLIVTFRRFKLSIKDLLHQVWRCLLAAAVMAVVLVWFNFGWAPVPASAGAMITVLLSGTIIGAIIYTGILLLAWHTCGRPDGAEALLLVTAGNVARALRRYIMPI
jgi:lipopolysaccharide exporter